MSPEVGSGGLLPLALALPILGAAALIAGRRLPRVVTDAAALALTAAVVGIDGAILHSAARRGRALVWVGGWKPLHGFSVGISFVADPLGAGLALLAATLILMSLLYSARYYDSAGAHLHVLMLLFLAGMEGLALSGDLFDMFVYFELMGAAAYALTGFKIEDPGSLQGAVNFGVINSLGAYMSLSGVALVYAHTGQLGLPELHSALAHQRPSALIVASFVLVSCGFLVKAAMAPFHFWLADAHAVAPAPVCVIFSGVMVEIGLYGFARVYWQVFSGVIPHADVRRAFIVAGVLTALVGAFMALAQRHLKRLLAYSTIAHVGMFMMGVATLSPDGTAGAAVYIAGHAGVKAALFLLAGYLLNRHGSVDEHALFGRGRADRLSGVLFILGGLTLSDLPPFGPGLGRSLVEEAVSRAGYPFGPGLCTFVSAVTGAAVLRAGLRIWFSVGPPPRVDAPETSTTGEEEADAPGLAGLPLSMLVPIGVLLGGSMAVGVVPGLAQAMAHGAERFTDASGYAAQALRGAPAGPTVDLPGMGWGPWGALLGGVSVAGALGLALASAYAPRLPAAWRRAGSMLGWPPVRLLRRLHSGHLGDYAAWLVLGLSGLAALIGVPLR